jgi:transposase-like protein
MALNGSGVRDTARVLRISPTTVIAVLKKGSYRNKDEATQMLLRNPSLALLK